MKAAYLSVTFGTFVEERNVIYLAPLLIVGAVVYFAARRPSPVALAVASVVCGWLVLGYGYQLGYPYFEAPGYGIAVMANRAFHWDQSTIRLGLAAMLVASVLVCALPLVRRPLGARAARAARLRGARCRGLGARRAGDERARGAGRREGTRGEPAAAARLGRPADRRAAT